MEFLHNTRAFFINKMMDFPDSFRNFLARNSIPPSLYQRKRDKRFFISLNKENITEEKEEDFTKEDGLGLMLDWYSLPVERSLAQMKSFKSGHLLSIDPSSSLAVLNLFSFIGNQEHSNIVQYLDMCCAPGPKMILAAHLLKGFDFYLTGVDVSKKRLENCRSLIKKYNVDRCRLFHTNSESFNLFPIVILPMEEYMLSDQKEKIPFHSSPSLRKRPTKTIINGKYNYILVDAPCTHDGSIKHIVKHQKSNWKEYKDEHYSEEYCHLLTITQTNILSQAFELLEVGGHILYSTCSMSIPQNEGVIDSFFEKYGSRAICKVPKYGPRDCLIYWGSGGDNICDDVCSDANAKTSDTKTKIAMKFKPDSEYYDGFFLSLIEKVY